MSGDKTVTLGSYVDVYGVQRDVGAGALHQYRAAARSFEWWAERQVPIADLTVDLVNHWVAFLLGTGMGRATIRNRRQHLVILWRHAHNSGLTHTFPVDIRPVKVPQKAPEAWTHNQTCKLLRAAANVEGTYRQMKRSKADWWDLAIRMAWDTGFRQGDLFSLKRKDITPDGLVVITQSKTGKIQVGKVHPSTLAVIEKLRIKQGKLVCPWPMTHEYFRQEFGPIVEAAGLAGSFKKLRKSSATDVEKNHPGAGASHLGHVPGSKIAAIHYLDPRIIGKELPMPSALPERKEGES